MHPLLERIPRMQMLAVFESAGRLGSFTQAASELGITQPGVSRHIRDLERVTGRVLFHRTANRVRLNAEGEAMLIAVQEAFATIDQHLRSKPRTSTTFLLAANPGFAQQWLVPHLDQLQGTLGDIDLWLRLFDRNRELGDEAYDAAIHLTTTAKPPPGTRMLFPERVLPVATPECADSLGLGSECTANDLIDVPKLHLDARDRDWLDWHGWFAAHGIHWEPTSAHISYNNYALVMNHTMAGHGVALAWRGLVDRALDSGALVAVDPEADSHGNAYQLIPSPSASAELLDRIATWLDEIRESPPSPFSSNS